MQSKNNKYFLLTDQNKQFHTLNYANPPSHYVSPRPPPPYPLPHSTCLPLTVEGKGKWNNKEQRIYIKFLEQNLPQMKCRFSRKTKKVFLKMSKLVKTRTADQCRSHHQKILKYHDSVQDIISYYKEEFSAKPLGQCKNTQKRVTQAQQIHLGFYSLSRAHNLFHIQIHQRAVQIYQPHPLY